MLRFVPLLLILALAVGANAGGNSIYSRAQTEAQANSIRGQSSSQLPLPSGHSSQAASPKAGISARKASWIAVAKPRPKDVAMHDLVTIIVSEVSKNSTKATTKSDREYSIEAALEDWLRLSGGSLRPDRQSRGDPKVKLNFNKEFEGKGDIKREDTVTARIQAEVIDVMPNGNLVIESTHSVTTDEETTTITLSGICRSEDVSANNTILSSQLAHLDLQKHHTGVARDATKPGFISGLLDFLCPF